MFPRCSNAARIRKIDEISSSLNINTFIADRMSEKSALSSRPSAFMSTPYKRSKVNSRSQEVKRLGGGGWLPGWGTSSFLGWSVPLSFCLQRWDQPEDSRKRDSFCCKNIAKHLLIHITVTSFYKKAQMQNIASVWGSCEVLPFVLLLIDESWFLQ